MRGALNIAALVVTGLLSCVVMAVVGVGGSQLGLPAWSSGCLAALLGLTVGGLGMVVHGQLDHRLFGARMQIDSVADLAARDLLLSTTYRARRACQMQEFEDEGSHYLLELEDGSLLYVTGQFLYQYEDLEDDDDEPSPRRFPCTEFTVHVHRKLRHVVAIDCRGEVIEPSPILDSGRLEPIRERLAMDPEEWLEVTHRSGPSFDELIGP